MSFRSALIAAVLTACALTARAQAAPVGADVERAAMRVAQTLDGVLRNCPATFARVGTEAKRCVGSGLNVEQVRLKLGGALGSDLYGVWRSRDEQRSVYNWLNTPAGYVYLRLQADPDGRAQTLVYLDVPLDSAAPTSGAPAGGTGSTQIGSVTLTPAAPTELKPEPARPEAAKPEPAAVPTSPDVPPRAAEPAPAPGSAPAVVPQASAPSLAPVPFRRVLQLEPKRLHGPDVAAVQNRLISLMRPVRPGQGDGWYGPVTAATVRAFQKANNLEMTGRVDRLTWNALFSLGAKTFTPPRPG